MENARPNPNLTPIVGEYTTHRAELFDLHPEYAGRVATTEGGAREDVVKTQQGEAQDSEGQLALSLEDHEEDPIIILDEEGKRLTGADLARELAGMKQPRTGSHRPRTAESTFLSRYGDSFHGKKK